MGHRNLFGSSQGFQGNSDQGWHLGEPPQFQMAEPGAPDSNNVACSLENTIVEGGQFIPQWNYAPVPAGYLETPIYPSQLPGPSRDPFINASAGGSLTMVPENPGHLVSLSNNCEQNLCEVDGGFFGHRTGNSRGSFKRKCPGIPAAFERGCASRYYNGSSSDQSTPDDPWLGNQNSDYYHAPWISTQVGDEANLRNVRSRPGFEPHNMLAINHLSNNPSQPSFTGQTSAYSSSSGFLAENPNVPSREWNQAFPSSASNGRNLVSDSSFFGNGTSHFHAFLNGNPNASLGMGGHLNDWHGSSSQYARGVRSSYIQRPVPTFRPSSSTLNIGRTSTNDVGSQLSAGLNIGRTSTNDVGSQLSAGSLSFQYPRPLSASGFRTGDQSGQSRIPSDRRYQTYWDDTTDVSLLHQDHLVADRLAIYESRTLLDQHRDMVLDVDTMSYEELLALGERIGCVNTGLSDDLIKKCLIESVYSYSDQQQLEEEKCVICLEEYLNMDDFGTLKSCGHHFHVSCIRKWLSIKNSCPICKASALDDSLKNK